MNSNKNFSVGDRVKFFIDTFAMVSFRTKEGYLTSGPPEDTIGIIQEMQDSNAIIYWPELDYQGVYSLENSCSFCWVKVN